MTLLQGSIIKQSIRPEEAFTFESQQREKGAQEQLRGAWKEQS